MPSAQSLSSNRINKVAIIGSHLPRLCGIATFTADLTNALAHQYPDTEFLVVAMNDNLDGYDYPDAVRFSIDDQDGISYRQAADFLNINNVDVVCLQHEYGIFGGQYGRMILDLLGDLRMPVITTLHTVLEKPTPEQKAIVQQLGKRSSHLVTMSHRGARFLEDVYGIPKEKITFIHHGIHDVPFVDPNYYKDQFGVEGKKTLLTFGLLSPGKGIETMIEALPDIVKEHPDVVYMVVGATHPHVRETMGESYRLGLQRRARELGVAEHLVFHDQFLELDELIEFIGCADCYVVPYPNVAQITSGTLAYALGAGKAIVSTPFWHAEELLAEDRGRLVPFNDPASMAREVNKLLADEVDRSAVRKRAYTFGRDMVWHRVADEYMGLLRDSRQQLASFPRFETPSVKVAQMQLPPIRLDAVDAMTDDTGMFQHAVYTVPNRSHGYSIDDNARALILCTQIASENRIMAEEVRPLKRIYLSYIHDAWNAETGRFRNFLTYARHWTEDQGSEDSHARAVWALGTLLGRSQDSIHKPLAIELFEPGLEALLSFTSPRAWAFGILGISEYLRAFDGDHRARKIRNDLATRLHGLYRANRTNGWWWFEPILSYCNARLPQALIVAAGDTDNVDMLNDGLEALEWLADVQRAENDVYDPIGCDGWYPKGGDRAYFDQQPVEAYVHVAACLDAWRQTSDPHWRKEASRAFEWFLGANRTGHSLYDPSTGGCRDALHFDQVNENQGAESILSFLLAHVAMGTFNSEESRELTAHGFTTTGSEVQHAKGQPTPVTT